MRSEACYRQADVEARKAESQLEAEALQRCGALRLWLPRLLVCACARAAPAEEGGGWTMDRAAPQEQCSAIR